MKQHFRRYTDPFMACARFVAQQGVLKPLIFSITRVEVLGAAKLKGLKRPFIVVANHSSHLDAPLIIGALPRRLVRHIATGAAADYFFRKWWLRAFTVLFFNAFPVERTEKAEKSGKRGIAGGLLQHNVPILLFPEGSRESGTDIVEFQPGAAALSIRRDVPCVPVALVGADAAMPRGSRWPLRGRPRIAVHFGAPVRAHAQESVIEFSRRLRDMVAELSESGKLPLSRGDGPHDDGDPLPPVAHPAPSAPAAGASAPSKEES